MTKHEKTYSVKYTGNADKNNQADRITLKRGAPIMMGGPPGELTEAEIATLRVSGLQLDVGKEVKVDDSGDDASKTGGQTATKTTTGS